MMRLMPTEDDSTNERRKIKATPAAARIEKKTETVKSPPLRQWQCKSSSSAISPPFHHQSTDARIYARAPNRLAYFSTLLLRDTHCYTGRGNCCSGAFAFVQESRYHRMLLVRRRIPLRVITAELLRTNGEPSMVTAAAPATAMAAAVILMAATTF